MVGFAQISFAALLGLLPLVHSHHNTLHVEIEAFEYSDCSGDPFDRFTTHEGKCRSKEFKAIPASGIRIYHHELHKYKNQIEDMKHPCYLTFYPAGKCKGQMGRTLDLHYPGTWETCINVTKQPFLTPVRAARLHCDREGPAKIYPQDLPPEPSSTLSSSPCSSSSLYSLFTPNFDSFRSTAPATTVGSSPQCSGTTCMNESISTVWESTTTIVIDAEFTSKTTGASMATAKNVSTATTTIMVTPTSTITVSEASESDVATSVSTTTILTRPTATLTGSTTVWVAAPNSTTKKVHTTTFLQTITESAPANVRRKAEVTPCFISSEGHWYMSTCADASSTTTSATNSVTKPA